MAYRLSSLSARSEPIDAVALRAFVDPRPAPSRYTGSTGRANPTVLAGWVARLQEGERNRGLFWAACRLYESGMPPREAIAALAPAAQQTGLGDDEIRATLRSAWRHTRTGGIRTEVHEVRQPLGPSPAPGIRTVPAMSPSLPEGIRIATATAVAGTVFIAAGAFWLSFTSLADLAHRSGISAGQSWAWPLIVDGIIVVATVAVVVLASSRAAWYPWALLFAGAACLRRRERHSRDSGGRPGCAGGAGGFRSRGSTAGSAGDHAPDIRPGSPPCSVANGCRRPRRR